MKSAEQWFDELPQHIGSRAKESTKPEHLLREYKGLKEALHYSFDWASSLEG